MTQSRLRPSSYALRATADKSGYAAPRKSFERISRRGTPTADSLEISLPLLSSVPLCLKRSGW